MKCRKIPHMGTDEQLQMTYSCFLKDKENNRIVRVFFERGTGEDKALAEAILPGGKIESSKGFTQQECAQLSEYLKAHEEEIFAQAKVISNPLKWL